MGEKSFERLTKGVGKREISEKKVGKSSTSFRRPWVKRISVAVRFHQQISTSSFSKSLTDALFSECV